MASMLDRVVAGTLIAATLTVAVSIAYRTFASPRASGPSAPVAERPVYQETWRETLPYGTTVAGSDSARVIIQEFTDLECPACRAYHPGLLELVSRHQHNVRLVYMPFPLSIHRFAMSAARAADCIVDTDPARLPDWVQLMYDKQDSLGLRSWGSLAADVGMKDTLRISACARSATRHARVDSTLAFGERHEIQGTPTLMVNGWMYRGLPSITALEGLVEQLLANTDPGAP